MKKRVALITGGYTKEAEISIKSAENVAKNIDPQVFDVYKIFIDKKQWYYVGENGRKINVDRNDFSIKVEGEKITFDIAFIMIHGSPGEDGKLQGYLEMLKIPHTACETTTAGITMNKAYTKRIVKDISGLTVADDVLLFKGQVFNPKDITKKLRYPLFVKPNNGGSSIGMSKVLKEEELEEAVKKAFKEGEQVLVEELVRGREFTVGAVKLNDKIEILPVTEIVATRDFFDFEAKYTPGLTKEITPATLSPSEEAIIKKVVTETYMQLSCKGVVRIDFILENNTGYFYFIEINTIPGQTDTSLIPQQVRATGRTMTVFYSELLDQISKK